MDLSQLVAIAVMIFSKVPAALSKALTPDIHSCRSTSLKSFVLGCLPFQILVHITNFLPVSSAASFALCCRPVFNIIGPQYWEALRGKGQEGERETFLLLLEGDLSDYVLCNHCLVLRRGRKKHRDKLLYQSSTQSTVFTPCFDAELCAGLSWYIHQGFQFGIFKMAMKRYRSEHKHNPYLGFLAHKEKNLRSPKHIPHQCIVQPKIVAGSLFIRVQSVLLIPLGQALEIPASWGIKICCTLMPKYEPTPDVQLITSMIISRV